MQGKEVTIRIAGEAGQGMKTIGHALSSAFIKAGFHIFANMDYMSRVRGGNNFFQIRVSENEVSALRGKADIIVALNKESVALHADFLASGGKLVFDGEKFGRNAKGENLLDVPFYSTTKEAGNDIYVNAATCGIVSAMLNLDFSVIGDVLKDAFGDKGEDIIEKNISTARKGYDLIKEKGGYESFRLVTTGKKSGTILMNGNEAIALGAIRGGCKFYTAYPMTPSTGIMTTIASYADKFNIVLEQAEDEIAAVNMAIGASFAGARSMTATSGGGFALMGEGLSLAGMTETPLVVVDAQRPAPATGLPTRTEQADLEFILAAGHGEFARVVYAPGSIEEAFRLTVKALDISDRYQIPALILTDQHLADSMRGIESLDAGDIKVRKHHLAKEESLQVKGYKRYELTDSGVSPRAVPSWIGDVIYVDSDEHTEEGHITESAEVRVKMVEKRFHNKMKKLSEEIESPVARNVEEAVMVLVGFGSTRGCIFEACDRLSDGGKTGAVHLPQLWPFPEKELASLLEGKKNIVTVENNASAQLARLIRRETGIKPGRSILRFDGRPFDVDYLLEKIRES